MRPSVTVLISGNGSNLQALIDASECKRLDIDLNHVISNKPDAKGVERARAAGIHSSVLAHDAFASREEYDRELAQLITIRAPDLVILAGFMRILGHHALLPFRDRIINLHPSLLPHFRGTDTYRRAINAGASEHGASIHFVTADLDGGPVISQVRIPIEADDKPQNLAARLAPREHELMVATVDLFSHFKVTCRNGVVVLDGEPLKQPLNLMKNGEFETP